LGVQNHIVLSRQSEREDRSANQGGEGGAREGGREGKGVDRDRGGERKEKGGRGEGEGGGDRKAKRRGVTDLSFTERNLSRSAALFPSRFKLDLCDSFLAFSKSDLRADRDFLY
jgi:hypothetical protein